MVNKLRHRITLQALETAKDDEAITIEKWNDIAQLWASVEPLKGREYFQAAAVNAEKTVRVYIRYRPGINSKMRVVHNARTYEIQSVIDVEERHKWLELMCLEVNGDG